MEALTLTSALSLAGIVALTTVVLNILALLGVIKGDSKERLANLVQTIVGVLLTLIGIFAPDLMDWVPMVDEAAELLAEIGGYVLLIIPLLTRLGNLFHNALARTPFLSGFLGYQLSPQRLPNE